MRQALEAAIATIIVPGSAVVLVPYLILMTSNSEPAVGSVPMTLIATLLAMVGASMAIWVSYAFVARGKGTPIPIDPPRNFVATGLFRFVRNPMYVGVLLVMIGETVFFRSLWLGLYTLCVWLLLHSFLRGYEEPQLRRRFGSAYIEYCARTPRWIPRLPRRDHPRDKSPGSPRAQS